MELSSIKERIELGLPGAEADVLDPRRDGVHLKAVVRYEGFQGKSLLEQHRMVMDLFREELKGTLHALAVETIGTKTKEL